MEENPATAAMETSAIDEYQKQSLDLKVAPERAMK